jgi:DNA-binding response OmpR family regulator
MGDVGATRVLVVDDEPMVHNAGAVPGEGGFEVDTAADRGGWTFDAARPDLVLLTSCAPRPRLEVFRRIRANTRTVIMITAMRRPIGSWARAGATTT